MAMRPCMRHGGRPSDSPGKATVPKNRTPQLGQNDGLSHGISTVGPSVWQEAGVTVCVLLAGSSWRLKTRRVWPVCSRWALQLSDDGLGGRLKLVCLQLHGAHARLEGPYGALGLGKTYARARIVGS